ncbi:hypothetical protein PtrSN002B_001294 [Pyrenophora tritici-repentis]|uniref:Pneumo-att-G multi-domain protein n=2 Tax=Pyrenophora tritici-repentis TaxID=45151 RepID=A0A2W1IC60_9PLEO|nr:uncharacterized protein PTRG_00862 [Pyrenophora tritici-repentis Pt-1C-BFP]KAA8625488.1 hypothetical protein PtrV1_01168 [Pyrenophora tritici-repentis]EDU40300.1 conserved hypothetical protein [Pyrenophora tritici-repentis Pt-1C-BFP]KAF7453889.1 hypothetical protein A1F99_011470 [Pyrenophora tritici-repentis]KAF7576980.1 Pneumo-att-G multi-domain protein [Pyrenophora tritici-repentis]KAG9387646.1 hypothetical protein A1F94_000538 [Pyrenophora tritici-repentis]
MVPIPADNNLNANTDLNAKPDSKYWTKANIALTIVFSLVVLAVILFAILFLLYRRHEKKKLANRKSDTAGLLANEDKTNNMFSRHRASSVTLYVDSEADARNKRSSTDTMHLVPLQVTPVEEVMDPIGSSMESSGSGVSSLSRQSNLTVSSMLLSPVSPTADNDRPSGRPRSTSTTSTRSQRARYYETTPTVEMPQIPKIVHTISQ